MRLIRHDPDRVSPFGHPCIDTISGSTWLIAANHVLLRLLTPRHPPSALNSLTTNLAATSPCGKVACGVKAKVRSSRSLDYLLTLSLLTFLLLDSANLAHVLRSACAEVLPIHVNDSRFVLLFGCQRTNYEIFKLITARLGGG